MYIAVQIRLDNCFRINSIINHTDGTTGLDCQRPRDGFYNGDLTHSVLGPCIGWYEGLFDAVSNVADYEPIRDLSAFAGEPSWEGMGNKCR